MDDPEVQKTVETVLGTKNVDIIDCEKKSSMKEEEYLLINGKRVNLEDGDGRAIRQALLTGQVPPCDLLNTLLIKTGILKAPVRLETQLSVKTSTITKEEVTVARDGKIVDERSREVKENNTYTTSSSEIWEPVKIIPSSDLPKYKIGESIPKEENQKTQKNFDPSQNPQNPLWSTSRGSPIPGNLQNPHWNPSRSSPIPGNPQIPKNFQEPQNPLWNASNQYPNPQNPDWNNSTSKGSPNPQNLQNPLWNASREYPNPQNLRNTSREFPNGQNPHWNSNSRASPIPKNFTQAHKSRDSSPVNGRLHSGTSRTHINGRSQENQFYVPQDLKFNQNSTGYVNAGSFGNSTNGTSTHGNFPHGNSPLGNFHGNPNPGNQIHGSLSQNFGNPNQNLGIQSSRNQSHGNLSYGNQSHGNLSPGNPSYGPNLSHNSINSSQNFGNSNTGPTYHSHGNPRSSPNAMQKYSEGFGPPGTNNQFVPNGCGQYGNVLNGKNGLEKAPNGISIDPYWTDNSHGYESSSEKFGSLSSASSNESEILGLNRFPSKDSGHLTNDSHGNPQSSGESLNSLDEVDFKNDLISSFRKCSLKTNGYKKDISDPTIFGTVASDLIPKDCSNRRSLPQTPQTSKNFSSLYNGDSITSADSISDSQLHHDNALVYRDGNLISGPLEALIQHTVPTETYYPDRAYLFAFLLSSRLFVKPHELLARIKSLGDQQQANSRTYSFKFAEYMVQLVTEWTETFPYDFRDERINQIVRQITQQCLNVNPGLHSNVQTLLQNLHQRLTALEIYEKSTDNFSEDQMSSDIMETCPNSSNLAQQLTHVELERLSFIGPEEFVQAFAKENPNIETSYKDMKKTKNLEQYVQWFNRLSYFVATQVCKHPKKKQRVRVVEYWIETARECFNIGNFNSLMAIIAGLNMSPISRLKKTWSKIQSGKFSILEHQMDPSSNFSSYRSTLKAAMWRSAGATDQRQRIVIPFFSLLVKDLYFLNEGCSNRLPNGHINFEKFWQLAKQVTEFMAWKQVTCPFEKDPKVISVLQKSPVLGENALALASFECEPPENNQERERCKSLKAETNNT